MNLSLPLFAPFLLPLFRKSSRPAAGNQRAKDLAILKRILFLIAFLVLSVSSAAAGQTPATLVSIAVTPVTPTLGINVTQTFIATGTFSDGTTQNLSTSVIWSSDTTATATISTGGVVTTGTSSGTATIFAISGNTVGSTLLTVTSGRPYAYVGSVTSANCCLDVLDTSTNAVVATIPMTGFTEPFGITPDQTHLYVADYADNLVDVVNTATNTLETTIPVGQGPNAVSITPDGQFGYTANGIDTTVSVFSVLTNTLVATIQIGFTSGDVSITPDGLSAYVSGSGNTIAVIDTKTNTVSSTFQISVPAGDETTCCVFGPVLNPSGTVGYVVQSYNTTTPGTVTVISIPAHTTLATITVGAFPFAFTLSPDGTRLYVTNQISNTVSVIDTGTNTVVATVPVATDPESIALSPDGTLVYVASYPSNSVSVMQASTNTVTSTFTLAGPFGILIPSQPSASEGTPLGLTPLNLIFNSQLIGTPSQPQTIVLKNPATTAAITINSVALTGPNIPDFSISGNSCPQAPNSLAGGATCNIQIVFEPTAASGRTALLTITSTNGVASSTQSAPLTGQGALLAAFSGLTPSQSIVAGATSIALGGTIGSGTTFPAAGETVSITVNGVAQVVAIGASGTFSTAFPTATIPAATGPYTITYSYAGDANLTSATDSSTTLTVTAPPITYGLTVTPIGTGSGTVTDNLQFISCVLTAGVESGTCSASYPAGTLVTLTATPLGNSTFAAWGSACTGTTGCLVTMNLPETVTASFTPPPQLISLTFNPGTTVTGMATYDCPSNPNPTPENPCTDPNAHALALSVPQVLQSITLSVLATEVPPASGNGTCPSGGTPAQDFDCRFVSFFTYQTNSSGGEVVPLCYPYANGNCVHYQVYSGTPGVEPNPSFYVGPIDWTVSWNNDAFVPPTPYTGSIPQLYDDPDYEVNSTSPYGTICSTPMLVNGSPTNPPIYCQFVFDITTAYFPNKKVDAGITGRTKQFNDVAVAFPPANVGNLTITDVPVTTPVVAGNPISFTITVTNSAGGAVTGAALTDALPAGAGVKWKISPTFSGPGSCAITGAPGSQVLGCSFGTITASQTFTIGLLSESSSVGTYTDTATTQVGNQQILSIATLTVQGVTATFSGLTPSQTIPAGTPSINLCGVIGNGTSYPWPGEKVSITIGGVTQSAVIGRKGEFSTEFPTKLLAASPTPYIINYSYPGDDIFGPATDTSTTLTVTSLAAQTITLTGAPASATYKSTFSVSATASSGLPVTITAGGACTLSGATVTMINGTGTCTVTAAQAGNSTYAPAQISKNVAAQKAASTTVIASLSPNPSVSAQAVTIAFGVSGVTAPTGTVSVAASTGETCTGALAGGTGSCLITFTTTGTRTLIASYSGDTNFNASVSASATQVVNPATPSSLSISPASVNFGQVPLGGLALKEVTLANSGKTAISISKIAMSTTGVGDFDDFFVISLCPGTLKVGANCILAVGYVPNREDSIGATSSGSVLITDNAVGSPQSVPLTAVTINPRASLSSTLLSFGTQKVGTTGTGKTVTLTSAGSSPLVLNSISVTGSYVLAGGTTCSAGESLAPTKSCAIVVEFSPAKTGILVGAVNVSDNTVLGQAVILLTGAGSN
jgi:YVTN family beta-propeller protein